MAWIKIGSAITDANGNLEFNNLPYGNYQIQETSTLTGYTVDSTAHPITINSATPVVEDLTNSPTEVGSLKIDKYSVGYPDFKLAGGKFKLMDSTGKTILSQSAATDANGNVTFNNLMSITGTPKSYEIVEVVAPIGYNINTQVETIPVTVGSTANVPVPNTPTLSGSIEVELTDTNYTEYGLAGADYDIYIEV